MIEFIETGASFLIMILAILTLVVGFIFLFRIRRPRKDRNDLIDYTVALNYLLSGEKIRALEKLKDLIRKNSSNVDAYVKIGDILRDLGQLDKAIKVHRELLIRSRLTPQEQIEILKSLVKDYREMKKYDKAIEICEQLLELTKEQTWVQELQLKLFEEKEDWEQAFEVRKKINRKRDVENDSILPLYKINLGLKLIEEGKEREGRIKYREALKIDKLCTPAYLYLCDSYIRESRFSDGLTVLKRFVARVPKLSYLAFDRIKEILFQQGDFGEIESIYNSLLAANPDIPSIRFELADIYERKGEVTKAISICEEILEKKPDSKLAQQYLIKYYNRIRAKDKALEIALKWVDRSISDENKYACHVCGHSAKEPYWYCPQCKEWNSYLN